MVTVGDDGGSSGRLRAERGGLPPGDLRQALVALAGDRPDAAPAAAVRRRASTGSARPTPGRDDGRPGSPAATDVALAGHAVGNLVLCGLMELLGDPVAALEHAGAMLGAVGRVLPMSCAAGGHRGATCAAPTRPARTRCAPCAGQHQVAVTTGRVESLRLTPAAPAACAEAVAAIGDGRLADLRAGQLVHQRASRTCWCRELADGDRGQPGPAAGHAQPRRREGDPRAVRRRPPGGAALVPAGAARSMSFWPTRRRWVTPNRSQRAAESLGARLVLAPVAVADGTPRHDPAALGAALVPVLGADR